MSDIGKVSRRGRYSFPTIRKSSDILQPESGDLDFAKELDEYNESNTQLVKEAENPGHPSIKDKKEQKHFKKKKKPQEEEEEEVLDENEDSPLIDLQA